MASEPSDDHTIVDDAVLWRRIHPRWVVPDEDQGSRISSAAFDDSRDGSPTSVLLADVVTETGRSATDVLSGLEGYGLASLTAGAARSCHQGVARDPVEDEPAHAIVFGNKSTGNRRCLARSTIWVIPIATVG